MEPRLRESSEPLGNEVDYGVGVVDGTAMPFATGAVASGGGVLADATEGSAAGEAAPAVGVLGGVGVSVGVGGAAVGVNVGVNVAGGMGVDVLVSVVLA